MSIVEVIVDILKVSVASRGRYSRRQADCQTLKDLMIQETAINGAAEQQVATVLHCLTRCFYA